MRQFPRGGAVTERERRPASLHPAIATFLPGADARDGVTPGGVAQLAESANLEEVVGLWRQAANGYGCSRAGKSGRCPCRGRAAAGRRRGVTYVVRSGARKIVPRSPRTRTADFVPA